MRHVGRTRSSRWGLPSWVGVAGLGLMLLACTSAGAPAAPTAAPAAPAAAPTAAPAAAPTTSAATSATPTGITPLNPPVQLKLALSYQVPNNLPLMLALQRGDFARAGLNVEVQTITGSSAAILPQISQGQIDIAQTVPAPALFNQAAQSFGVKLVAGGDVAKPGRIPSAILLVEKDEASQIQQLSDLKGKTIEGAAQGSPISLTVETAVREAGLTPGQDVTITYRVKDPSDFLALIRNHAADVVGTTSSTAVQAGDYAVPWK